MDNQPPESENQHFSLSILGPSDYLREYTATILAAGWKYPAWVQSGLGAKTWPLQPPFLSTACLWHW